MGSDPDINHARNTSRSHDGAQSDTETSRGALGTARDPAVRSKVMARRPREVSASGFYHPCAGGTGGLAFFDDEDDHDAQYSLYGRVVERHGWTVHSHCLMHTHHHVLVEVPGHEALVRGMHLLGTCQAMRLNSRRERFGHVT